MFGGFGAWSVEILVGGVEMLAWSVEILVGSVEIPFFSLPCSMWGRRFWKKCSKFAMSKG